MWKSSLCAAEIKNTFVLVSFQPLTVLFAVDDRAGKPNRLKFSKFHDFLKTALSFFQNYFFHNLPLLFLPEARSLCRISFCTRTRTPTRTRTRTHTHPLTLAHPHTHPHTHALAHSHMHPHALTPTSTRARQPQSDGKIEICNERMRSCEQSRLKNASCSLFARQTSLTGFEKNRTTSSWTPKKLFPAMQAT